MTGRRVPARWPQGPRTLAPHYFALVMASGIVSVGLAQHGYWTLSAVPWVVAVTAYVVLLILNGWRVLAHRDAVRDDVTDPARAFGTFTFVAGTNVLGVRLALSGHTTVAVVLLVVATVSWVVLGYLIPWTAMLGPAHRPVLADANGSWFIWVVAGQSVAVAAAVLEPAFPGARVELATVAIFAWSVGVFLYGAVGTMVSARLLLFHLRAEQIGPPYWIAMGAAAIGVLAGAHIVKMQPTPLLLATRGLISGVVVIMWAFATWLIPALVAFGWWQHRRHRVLRGYDPSLWSIVFPLGMYAVAGTYLGRADQLPLAREVGAAMTWVAGTVWLITLLAMLRHLFRPRAALAAGVSGGSGMPIEAVLAVLDALEQGGVRVWLDGGWGVDALVGRQTRPHRDLDLALDVRDEDAALKALRTLGYEIETDQRPTRVELAAPGSRSVDLHPLTFEAGGDGIQRGPAGERWVYPAAGFATGSVAGRTVGCISAAQQMRFHSGYDLSEKDHHDLALLQGLLRER